MSPAAGAESTSVPSAVASRRAPLPERPPISRPDRPPERIAPPGRGLRQPWLGLAGLLLVVPVAFALAVGAGGDGSVLVIAPLVTYSLPLVAMVAFWWEDWPGTRLRARWSGWADTALIAAGAVVLTGIGQAVAGGLDPAGLFDPSPGPGHVPTFPATMPLAGAAFVAMLQLTLVGEGWPLRRLPRLPAGLAALAVSWAVALAADLALVETRPPAGSDVTARDGPVPGVDFGAALVVIGAWQVLFYVVWRGWPFSSIDRRATRLGCAHTVVIGGVLTFLAGHDLLGIDSPRLAAVAGCFVAAGLLLGMLVEGWAERVLRPGAARVALLLATLASAALLAVLLGAAADVLPLTRVTTDDWVEHAALNALGVSIILHVAVGRRRPFAGGWDADSDDAHSDRGEATAA
jgi:hypothetical protein